jgi:hypothetical protein
MEKTGTVCTKPPSTGTGNNALKRDDGWNTSAATCSATSADRAEEEAAAAEATDLLEAHSSRLLLLRTLPRCSSNPARTSTDGGMGRRSITSAWADYTGSPIQSINHGPSIGPRSGVVVQWFSFATPKFDPLRAAPGARKFTMEDTQFSWNDAVAFPTTRIDDPSGSASEPPLEAPIQATSLL